MNLNDLERVNALAAQWRKLDAIMQRASMAEAAIVVGGHEPYKLDAGTAVKILNQLKSDVENQLANYNVRPPAQAPRSTK